MSIDEVSIFSSWHSYPKVFALGHRALAELFMDEVQIEEKIDGSQFSFGRFNGELKCRSKGARLNVEYPEKMFATAVKSVKELELFDGWTYRGEYLASPKHNALVYDRVPKGNMIIFDINTCEETYLSYEEKAIEAARMGLEVVPLLYRGRIDNPGVLLDFLSRTSVLGGQKIEGVVVKNYQRFGPDKKALMGKYVSEAFKEVHAESWKEQNPKQGDIVERLILKYKTSARWAKSVQHLREAGQLTDSPKDIGMLIKAIQRDVQEECEDEIKDELFKWAFDHIRRGLTGGLPEWYKEQLLKLQFEQKEAAK